MERVKFFENPSLSIRRNNQLNEYRKINKFTDLSLRSTDGKTIAVHKTILSASCPYFEALFNSGLVETRQEIIQLVDNVTIADLEIIIEYIYTGKAEVCLENAENLFIKSQYFQLLELTEFCSEMLIENIKIDNCLNYLRNSVKYFNDNLTVQCLKFIRSNLKCFLEDNVMSLTAEEYKLIMSEEIFEMDQEELYKFVVKWVKEDFETRTLHLMELIKNIDFSKMCDDFIETQIISDASLQSNREFLTKLLSITFQKLRVIQKQFTLKPSDDFILRTPLEQDEKLNSLNCKTLKNMYLIRNGGIYKLNLNELEWTKMKQFSYDDRKVKYFATAAFQYDIFISGGWHDKSLKQGSSFKYWNIQSHNIIELPEMLESRYHHNLVNFKNKIYSCGGLKNNGSTEMFDLEYIKWYKGPYMNENKNSFGLISSVNSLYAFGGWNADSQRSNIVEQYDPRVGKWCVISKDTPAHSQTAMLSNNCTYCFENISSGNMFDLRTNKWTNSLPAPLEENKRLQYYVHSNAVVEFNDLVFGVFQTDESETWGTFKYDHNANKWTNLNINLKLNKFDDIRLCTVSEL